MEYLLPVLIGVAVALGFFFIQKDLGPALFLSFVFLAMYAVARRRAGLAVAGLALLIAGFYVGYRLEISQTLAERVRIWQSPWDNTARGGDQIAQAHWALATGGISGTGLGIGDSRYVPAGHTDLALAAIGEELGVVGLLLIAVVYGLVVRRGFRIARAAPSDYAFFLALAVTLMLIVPVLVMAGGMLGSIPLTGVVTPFLSYGGSAMVVNLTGLGILAAIHGSRRPAAATEPFRAPLRSLAAVLGASAAVLVAGLVKVQAVQPDDYLVRPQLSMQADGGRRYLYNARVLDVARQIPRGTIFDRQGLPLATGDPDLVAKSADDYRTFDIEVDRSCPNRGERCYPLGGVAFHVLGDARTRLNWSASNSSYIERDAEDRLRGFDDHETTIRTTDESGDHDRGEARLPRTRAARAAPLPAQSCGGQSGAQTPARCAAHARRTPAEQSGIDPQPVRKGIRERARRGGRYRRGDRCNPRGRELPLARSRVDRRGRASRRRRDRRRAARPRTVRPVSAGLDVQAA